MLESELQYGLIVLALIHSGKITINCIDCDDAQKEQYCCSGSESPVFEHDNLEFYCCPLKFLTKEIYDWFDEANYYEAFPGSAPKYGDHNNRFWMAYKLYKSTYNKNAYDTKANNKENKTDNTLRNFKQKFKNAKH